MTYKQNGLEVTVARVLIYIFLIAIASCLLMYAVGMWFSIAEGSTVTAMLVATFFYGLFVVGMSIFVVYHYWKFPKILTTEKGLQLQFPLHTLQIDWNTVIRVQRKRHRLVIFLNTKGLLLNRLYGLLDAKVWDQPVVLFDSSDNTISDLETDIKNHLNKVE